MEILNNYQPHQIIDKQTFKFPYAPYPSALNYYNNPQYQLEIAPPTPANKSKENLPSSVFTLRFLDAPKTFFFEVAFDRAIKFECGLFCQDPGMLDFPRIYSSQRVLKKFVRRIFD